MARVFTSTLAGDDVFVLSHDHCPPHVTVRHGPDVWVARIRFSFVTDAVVLWDVEPQRNAPRRRDLNLLLDEVQDALEAGRRLWWLIQGTVCLDNRWVRVAASGPPVLTLLTRHRSGAQRVKSARYDVAKQELSIGLQSGPVVRIAAGSGNEL